MDSLTVMCSDRNWQFFMFSIENFPSESIDLFSKWHGIESTILQQENFLMLIASRGSYKFISAPLFEKHLYTSRDLFPTFRQMELHRLTNTIILSTTTRVLRKWKQFIYLLTKSIFVLYKNYSALHTLHLMNHFVPLLYKTMKFLLLKINPQRQMM